MFKKTILLASIILSLCACIVRGEVINSTWVGGEYGGWETASNWDPAIVPNNNGANTFNVTIDGGSDERKHVSLWDSYTIDRMECYGNVWVINLGPYNINLFLEDPNGLKNYGKLRLRGGPYNEILEFTINGNVKNESGSVIELFGTTIEDEFYNAYGAIAWVKYEVIIDSVQNYGEINILPSSEMSVNDVNNSGHIKMWGATCATFNAPINNDANGFIEGFGVVHSGNILQNKGTIYASGGSLILNSDYFLVNTGTLASKSSATLHLWLTEDMNNNGTIEVNADSGVVVDCNLTNMSNSFIKLFGGNLAAKTIFQEVGSIFEGFGGITGDVVIESNAIIKLTGPTNVVGDVNIAPNATLEISDGTTLVTGHTTCNGTIHMKGGYVIPQGGLSGDCNVIWEPGLYTNVADFNLDGKVNFNDFAYFANVWLWQSGWY